MSHPLDRLRQLPRLTRAHLPTPLEEAPRRECHLGLMHGIDVDAQPERVAADVKRIGRAAAARLGDADGRWRDEDVEVCTGYARSWYGVPDSSTLEAIGIAARLEALVLDPVYSGKGMASLIGLVRAGRFAKNDVVVWIHTGGSPGAFAYPAAMSAASRKIGP